MFDHVQQAKLHLFTFGLLIRPRVPSHLEGCTCKSTMQVVSRIEPATMTAKASGPHLASICQKIQARRLVSSDLKIRRLTISDQMRTRTRLVLIYKLSLVHWGRWHLPDPCPPSQRYEGLQLNIRTQSLKMQTLKTWNKTLLHLQTHHHRHFTLTCKNPRPLWIFHSSNHTSPLTN